MTTFDNTLAKLCATGDELAWQTEACIDKLCGKVYILMNKLVFFHVVHCFVVDSKFGPLSLSLLPRALLHVVRAIFADFLLILG